MVTNPSSQDRKAGRQRISSYNFPPYDKWHREMMTIPGRLRISEQLVPKTTFLRATVQSTSSCWKYTGLKGVVFLLGTSFGRRGPLLCLCSLLGVSSQSCRADRGISGNSLVPAHPAKWYLSCVTPDVPTVLPVSEQRSYQGAARFPFVSHGFPSGLKSWS